MGCGNSSVEILSSDWYYLDIDEMTKTVELTYQHKYLIRETWQFLEVSKRDIGIAVYKRFLNMHPELKQYFSEFRSIDVNEINGKHGHPKRLLMAISHAVSCLGDSESYFTYLVELGRRHCDLSFTITQTHFDDLRKCFVSVIMEILASASFWNSEVEKAWNALFCSISTMLLKGLAMRDEN